MTELFTIKIILGFVLVVCLLLAYRTLRQDKAISAYEAALDKWKEQLANEVHTMRDTVERMDEILETPQTQKRTESNSYWRDRGAMLNPIGVLNDCEDCKGKSAVCRYLPNIAKPKHCLLEQYRSRPIRDFQSEELALHIDRIRGVEEVQCPVGGSWCVRSDCVSARRCWAFGKKPELFPLNKTEDDAFRADQPYPLSERERVRKASEHIRKAQEMIERPDAEVEVTLEALPDDELAGVLINIENSIEELLPLLTVGLRKELAQLIIKNLDNAGLAIGEFS